jgi:hypothetical protein
MSHMERSRAFSATSVIREADEGGATGEAGAGGGHAPLDPMVPALRSSAAGGASAPESPATLGARH